ncbi:phosphatidylserine/phosphatidylglycerophosphate/cardiolipin synthase family protein [Paenibacillus rhizovicinus]|uniref:Phosphatidylserine/phosphatidylglycerophosphate/ cardiolipin synthase family protein n=1 Tax=Paenibacillus rhizovicinus TaxID=2704463 RepID=A0A6C0P8J4_9BACL|nr:phosphatidylserine/phosphatidylglycerophosphate/cardiolipin synthase family protein [Paenibacillus rhizovicinus]QHW34736.1 phosphatidylserine/phosphatidylglycerophosphate/cardiolipin synthase family protein [Paenibacillus rhizovicinus]
MEDDRHLSGLTIPYMHRASYPIRSGNAIRPLVDGEPAFRRICEAIEAATHSVWTTITFMWAACQMPDGRGSPLDVLHRAAARGLDVRIIYWRPDPETESLKTNAFWGAPEHFERLRDYASPMLIRWDRAHPGYCQHQKSWLIDAGTDAETAFLGGINLNPNSMVAPGHGGKGQNHDAYVELNGPSLVDVHHNFVQRWNEASERDKADGSWSGTGSMSDLPFPIRVPKRQGDAIVQIQRTIHRDRYTNGQASPGGDAFDIAAGERSNLDQYCAAIDSARSSIYIENQAITVQAIVDGLHQALLRGVEVAAVIPADGEIPEALAKLAVFGNFTLAGLAGIGDDGERHNVWVHSKLMLVDGHWGTVGSCNLHRYSLFGNSEMNAAFWHRETAHAMLSSLFEEHLGSDITGMDDRAALQLFAKIARTNRLRLDQGDNGWQGLAFSLLLPPYHD